MVPLSDALVGVEPVRRNCYVQRAARLLSTIKPTAIRASRDTYGPISAASGADGESFECRVELPPRPAEWRWVYAWHSNVANGVTDEQIYDGFTVL